MRRMKAGGAIAVVAFWLLLLAGPVEAQTTYPITDVTCQGVPGQVCIVTLGPFDNNAVVTKFVNGQRVPETGRAVNGVVSVEITVVSVTPPNARLSVDDPLDITVPCSPTRNTVTGTGTSGGVSVNRSRAFTVVCTAAAGGGGQQQQQQPGGSGQQQTGGGGQQQQQQQRTPLATPVPGRVAFTGSNFVRLSAIACVLVAAGAWVLTIVRSRRVPAGR